MSYVGKHRAPGPRRRRVPYVREAATLTGVAMAATLGSSAWQSLPAVADVNWDAVAQCESGGNWSIATGNGFYGGLQFTLSTWQSNGGSGMPQYASRDEQIRVANNVLHTQGISAWPVCGARAGTPTNVIGSGPTYNKPVPPVVGAIPRHAAPRRAAPTSGTYVVAAGDTLSELAAAHGLPGWGELYAINRAVIGGDPNAILPGEVLELPS